MNRMYGEELAIKLLSDSGSYNRKVKKSNGTCTVQVCVCMCACMDPEGTLALSEWHSLPFITTGLLECFLAYVN